jgi:uncharacterized membrane protein YphA (DoxX/SURF4 family)
MNNNKLAVYFLRFGLAFVLVYAAVEIYLHPDNFLKYVPKMILNLVPLKLFLDVFGVIEVVLAAWLLIGWKGHIPSLLTVLMMAGIVVCNPEYFQVLFRNVAIGFGGLALILLEKTEDKTENKSVKA